MNSLRSKPSPLGLSAARLLPVLLLVALGLASLPAPRTFANGGQFGRYEGWQAGQPAILVRAALRGMHAAALASDGGEPGDDVPAASASPLRQAPGTASGIPASSDAARLPPAGVRPQSPRAPPFPV